MEEWKYIKDYPNYMISNQGNVKSLKYGKEKKLNPTKDKYGYLRINLCKDGKYKMYSVHRLVANAFISNTDNKPCIDHINTDKTDNRIENLRWVTNKENSNNPITIKKWKGENNYKTKPLLQFDKNMNFVRKWECIADIERKLGFKHTNISNCCLGIRKTASGYKWGFEKDYEKIPFKVFDLTIYNKKSFPN